MATLLGRGYIERLVDLGVVPPETQSVTIEAAYDDIVRIYVEQVGTTSLLDAMVPICPYCGMTVGRCGCGWLN